MDLVGGVVLLALGVAMVRVAMPGKKASTPPSSATRSSRWCGPSPA
jgi:hypothetical protein